MNVDASETFEECMHVCIACTDDTCLTLPSAMQAQPALAKLSAVWLMEHLAVSRFAQLFQSQRDLQMESPSLPKWLSHKVQLSQGDRGSHGGVTSQEPTEQHQGRVRASTLCAEWYTPLAATVLVNNSLFTM